MFGDSNTYGLVPATTDRYGWGVRWTSIINEKLGLQEYRVIEEGLCGRTTVFDDPFREGRRGTQLFPTLLETHRLLDCIVIMLGTNDCKTVYGASAGVIAKGVEKLIEQAQRFAKDTPILLISPIHLGEGVWEKGFDTEFNENSVAVSKGLAEEYRKSVKNTAGIFKCRGLRTAGSRRQRASGRGRTSAACRGGTARNKEHN